MGDEEVVNVLWQIWSKVTIACYENKDCRVYQVERDHEEHVAESVCRHFGGGVEADARVYRCYANEPWYRPEERGVRGPVREKRYDLMSEKREEYVKEGVLWYTKIR